MISEQSALVKHGGWMQDLLSKTIDKFLFLDIIYKLDA